MKRITLLILTISVGWFGFAQEQNITIDHIVDYIVTNNQKGKNDSISVGFSEDGKYIWTNSKFLAKDLGKSIFNNKPELLNNSDLDIIYNTETSAIMLCFKSGENKMFMNILLSTFMPATNNPNAQEEFALISEKTGETLNILNRNTNVYSIFPSNKTEESISIAFDQSIEIKNNKLFKKLFAIIFESEGGSNLFDIDIPNGLIMKVFNQGQTVLEAYNFNSNTKTITINYSFKITE